MHHQHMAHLPRPQPLRLAGLHGAHEEVGQHLVGIAAVAPKPRQPQRWPRSVPSEALIIEIRHQGFIGKGMRMAQGMPF